MRLSTKTFSNKVMNSIIATTTFIVSAAFSMAVINPKIHNNKPNVVEEEKIYHDWECKFIIEDCYTGYEHMNYHYVNEYQTNVDGSISFISHDGTNTWIPYPYYNIIVNEK